jgi:glycosyltransferase involved in cell wall biosynthesis
MRPRVLHVIPFLWSGAGHVVSQLAVAQRVGRDVALVSSGTSRGLHDWPAYRRRLRAAGVRHHAIDFFDRDSATFCAGVEALARLVSAWRPAVVHTHAGVPACAAAVVRDAVSHRFRHVNHVYNWGAGRPQWMNTMDLSGIRRADRVICSARAYETLLRTHGVASTRLRYIPWGLDLDAFDFGTNTSDDRRRVAPRIGFVGRIEPRKGQLDLVNAFARLWQRVPGARLELIGPVADEAYASAIARVVRAHRLTSAVTLRGHVRDPWAHASRWDLFVSLASDEGQGLAVLEAMAAGVPVVARRAAGIDDYLEDGLNGWSCPTSTPAGVVHAMTRALSDSRTERIRTRARTMVERRYNWTTTVRLIDRTYRGL